MDSQDTGDTAGTGGRRPGPDRDWTEGSIAGNLLRLSWPMVVSSSLNMVGPTIDMIWVGRLGSAAIAGVGVGGIAVGLLMSSVFGLAMGMRAMVARFIGAHDLKGANHVALQSFVVSTAFAAVVAMVGLFFADSIMRLFPLEEEVILEGATYTRVMFLGAVVMSVRMMCEAAMQSAGDTVTPMWVSVLFRVIHVALCPFMVLGWWIFPRLGVSGAALTNIISQSVGLCISLWLLFSGRSVYLDSVRKMLRFGRSRMKLTLENFRIDPVTIWRIVRIGIPSSVTGMQSTLGQFILIRFMSAFGTVAVAAHTISQRAEMILIMPVMGLGTSAGILAGQNLGAGQPERAEKGGWMAAGMALGLVVACCLGLLLGAESVVAIFSKEPGVIDLTSTFLRIATAGYVLIGFVMTFQFCVSGAGDTVPPMLMSLFMTWAVQLPMAYVLPKYTDLGVYGVRWAIVISLAVAAVANVTYFRTGRWKRKRF